MDHSDLQKHKSTVPSRIMPFNQLTELINKFVHIVVCLIVIWETNVMQPDLRPKRSDTHIQSSIMWNKRNHNMLIKLIFIKLKRGANYCISSDRMGESKDTNTMWVVSYFCGENSYSWSKPSMM